MCTTPYGCDHYGAVNNHFPVYKAIFGIVIPNLQPTNQSIDYRASLNSEKAVSCKILLNPSELGHVSENLLPAILPMFF